MPLEAITSSVSRLKRNKIALFWDLNQSPCLNIAAPPKDAVPMEAYFILAAYQINQTEKKGRDCGFSGED
jgi:hypothetical protein